MGKTTKDEKGTSTLWKEAGIPPLDYCTLDRATRLLNCEIEDIWHWRERYHIDFYVHVDFREYISVESEIEIKDNAESFLDLLLNNFSDCNFSFPFLSGLIPPCPERGDFSLFTVYKPVDETGAFIPSPCELKGNNIITLPASLAYGLFKVGGVLLQKPHPEITKGGYSTLRASFECDAYKYTAKSSRIHLDKLENKNFYLVKADLEYIYESRVRGSFEYPDAKIGIRIAEQHGDEEGQSIDKRGLHHSLSRENHIMALVYAFINYKDEIFKKGKYGKSRHVSVTLDHWKHIAPGIREPSDRHLLNILRDFHKLPHERITAGTTGKQES